jgi:hypothetical protein
MSSILLHYNSVIGDLISNTASAGTAACLATFLVATSLLYLVFTVFRSDIHERYKTDTLPKTIGSEVQATDENGSNDDESNDDEVDKSGKHLPGTVTLPPLNPDEASDGAEVIFSPGGTSKLLKRRSRDPNLLVRTSKDDSFREIPHGLPRFDIIGDEKVATEISPNLLPVPSNTPLSPSKSGSKSAHKHEKKPTKPECPRDRSKVMAHPKHSSE